MVFLYLLIIVAAILLLLTSAVRLPHSQISLFELERLAMSGDKDAKKALKREKRMGDIAVIRRLTVAILTVALTMLVIAVMKWQMGIITMTILVFLYGLVVEANVVQNIATIFYNFSEKYLFRFIKKFPLFIRLIGGAGDSDGMNNVHINSRQEFEHIIAESSNFLTSSEKKLIIGSLSFKDQLVKDYMTPRDKIVAINKSELLGPLVLDNLHKAGHNHLPVIDASVDNVVGTVGLKNLFSLDVKKSATAEKVMDQRVLYVHKNQTLQQALAVLLKTHFPLLIVVNETGETVGLLSIGDIVGALIGYEISDEFDNHESLDEVAKRYKKE